MALDGSAAWLRDVTEYTREIAELEEHHAQVAAFEGRSSPLYHSLQNHQAVASPCGLVRASIERPDALTTLRGRVSLKSPADGLFDPTLLGSAEARDDLLVELCKGPGLPKSELRLWCFLAHLVVPADLFPVEDSSDGEETCKKAVAKPTQSPWPRGDLQGAFEEGNWTGTLLWDAALHATAFVLGSPEWSAAIAESSCVLELGAGLGLPALVCARALGAKCVVATDRAPQVLDLLDENMQRNTVEGETQVLVRTLDWSAEAAKELPAQVGVSHIDVVICCDCILEHLFGAASALAEFLAALAASNPGLRVLLSSEMRPACGVGRFLQRVSCNFEVRRAAAIGLVHLYELRPLET